MKYKATLNNYQMGSYDHRCLQHYIISEHRIDKYHTEVIWDIPEQYEVSLLKKVLGADIYPNRLKVVEEN